MTEHHDPQALESLTRQARKMLRMSGIGIFAYKRWVWRLGRRQRRVVRGDPAAAIRPTIMGIEVVWADAESLIELRKKPLEKT